MLYQGWTRAGQGYRSTYLRRSAMLPTTSGHTSPATLDVRQPLDYSRQGILLVHVISSQGGQEQLLREYLCSSLD